MTDEFREKHFNPKAHILTLLGEELIKSPVMAIYELVKNSYDADATKVDVLFRNTDNVDNAAIIVEDDGVGMTSEIIENVWLEPGTDNRKPYNSKTGLRQIIKSAIYKRVPMGEKGIGRFAVHKLGKKILLISRPMIIKVDGDSGEILEQKLADYEIQLFINWKDFNQSKHLSDIPIKWKIKRDVKSFHFKENSGTYIHLSGLKETWTRSMARSLKRNTVSMLSPKNDDNKFSIYLSFQNNWLDGFPNAQQILEIAPYKYTALLDENYNLTVDYEHAFLLNEPYGSRRIEGEIKNIKGALRPKLRKKLEENLVSSEDIENTLDALVNTKNPFGNILFEIYSFDLDAETLRNYTYDAKTLKNILKLHSGIKVFKDEMRVFNYGEPGDDWLEVDLERVQNKRWFSNNQVVAFIYLDSEKSTSLIEKTNREGFIENDNYKLFWETIRSVITDFRDERHLDRRKWLNHIEPVSKSFSYQGQTNLFKELIDTTDFSKEEQKTKLKEEADKLEKDFEKKKQILLIPAGVGMTASVALHEIEKLVPRMKEVINNSPFKVNIANDQIKELNEYLSGILSVLRKGGELAIPLEESINKAIDNYSSKFERRRIEIEVDFDKNAKTIKCDKRYFVTMIMNIIDNSVYWLDTMYKKDKSIYFKTIKDEKVTSIIIVDNGPGFKDEITDVVQPFFSRKEDGIGIGLYLIDTLMMKYGKLEIVDSEEELVNLNIPKKYRGAAIKLTFNKK